MSSKKALQMAEQAVDNALRSMPISKAYGAGANRDLLVSLALPCAEMAVKAEKLIARNDQSVKVMARQSDITDAALRQTETALTAVEALHKRMSAPSYGQQHGKVLDDFVMHSSPQTIPQVNGHSPERIM